MYFFNNINFSLINIRVKLRDSRKYKCVLTKLQNNIIIKRKVEGFTI